MKLRKSIVVRRNGSIALWTAVIVILSLLPKSALQHQHLPLFKGADKIVHFIMYLILMWLWYLRSLVTGDKKYIIAGTIYSIALGVVLEYIQRDYIAGRTFDVYDILANITGVFAVIIFIILKNLKNEF